MEDFIFGTLSTDPLKMLYHRTISSGIQHAYVMRPRDPKPGEIITLIVESGPDVVVEQMACYYTVDGKDPIGTKGKASIGEVVFFKQVDLVWDTISWGYRKKWQTEIPAQPEGTEVRYVISGWNADGDEIYADWPDAKLTIENSAKNYFETRSSPKLKFMGNPSKPKIFNYFIDRLAPPTWAKEAIIYHIFVDRFNPGGKREWKQVKNLKKIFGGTISGVMEKIDYISQLGANTIWLSPIFPSPSIHRYDAINYYEVAEELGGDEALRMLVEKAHDKGIRILLDLVCNHISFQHPYFLDAYNNKHSQYRDWFYFNNEDEIGYRTFFGVHKMPQVNLNHPDARQWMFNIARYWLEEFDVDGFRLDHANGPGPGFWVEFWQVCKEAKSESICIGEVVEPPDIQSQYRGRMDGLLDFHLCEALRKGVGTTDWSSRHFRNFLSSHMEYWDNDFLMASFLDNHDMDRFLFIVENDIEKLKQAAEIQFKMPGPPIIYYGTEVGLKQTLSKTSMVGLEASRGAMIWGQDQDKSLFRFYQDLIQKRMIEKPWETENK